MLMNYRESEFVLATHRICTSHLERAEFDLAKEKYYKAIKFAPKESSLYYGLGQVFIQENQPVLAFKSYKISLHLNPRYAQAYYKLGDLFFSVLQGLASALAYINAIYFGISHSFVVGRVGLILEQLVASSSIQSTERCRQLLQQGIKFSSLELQIPTLKEAEFYVKLADRLNREGYYTGSLVLYEIAMLLDIKNTSIQQKHEKALLNKSQEENLKNEYLKEIDRDPSSITAYKKLGNLLSKLGYFDRAKNCYLKSCDLQGWTKALANRYVFTNDFFTSNIPIWLFYLNQFQSVANVSFLEIGSYQGMSTCWLLDNILTHDSARITCIDLQFQPVFYPNIKKTGAERKVIPLLGYSDRFLRNLTAESYDFIYIDGCHLSVVVFKDALLCWELVKIGGFIFFDDYKWTDPDRPNEDPKLGIDAFLSLFDGELEIVFKEYQLGIKKISKMQDEIWQSIRHVLDRDFKDFSQLERAIQEYNDRVV